MSSRPAAVAWIAAGCMLAAGLGAYLAVRRNAADVRMAGAAAVTPAQQAVAAGSPAAVAETEAFVPQPGSGTPAAPVRLDPSGQPEAREGAGIGSSATPPAPTQAGRRSAARVDSTSTPRSRRDSPVVVSSGPPPGGWTGGERPWPPAAEVAVPVSPGAPVVGEPLAPEALEPPAPRYEELVVAADSVIGVQIEHAISSEHARLEDPVEARVTRDVLVGGKIAIPAGTRVLGSVTLVERGGKVKERARLGIRFHTLVLADATRVPIHTESVFREGEPPSNESVAKIGGAAVGGAILGAILGGTKGAVIGGATGAAGGTAAVMAGDRNPATLPAGATLTVRLTAPVTVTVQK
jgi:hypothetical protein